MKQESQFSLHFHRNHPILKVIQHFLVVMVGLLFILPFVWMVSTSLKTEQDVFRVPQTWLPRDNKTIELDGNSYPLYDLTINGNTQRLALIKIASGKGTFIGPEDPQSTIVEKMKYAKPVLEVRFRFQNYIDAMNRSLRPGLDVNFWTYVKNSLIITFFTVIGTVFSCALPAYGFAKIEWPGRDMMFILVLSTMMLPFQVTMIPMYIFFTKVLGWGNSFLPLIVPTFFGNAYLIFMMRQFYRTIPQEICDAAKVDGASDWQIFLRIILPLTRPVIATVAVFSFLWTWNDFTGPLIYLTDPSKFTIAIGLQDYYSQHAVAWNQLMAAAVVFTLPIIVAFFFAQKTFIQGVKLTGIKE